METRFRQIRKRLGLTQTQAGEIIGVPHQSSVARIESGEYVLDAKQATLLVHYAREHGLALTLDMVYGLEYLPAAVPAVQHSSEPNTKGA